MGAPFRYKNPEDLRKDALAYFEWCDKNPIRGSRSLRKDDGTVVTIDTQLPRPYSFEGLADHIGIDDYAQFVKDNKERPGFGKVFCFIRTRVRRNQIEGGLVGIYKEGLTARLNGIADNMNIGEAPPPSVIQVIDGPEE